MDNTPSTQEAKKSCSVAGLSWWATLIVAVLAVPSFGIIVSSIIPVKGIGEVLVFIIACWLCTFLGMHLMRNPRMSQKFNLTHHSDRH